jgi:hypothetical protein
MKSKIIKEFLNDYFSEIKISKEMFNSIERIFDEFILDKKSNKLENNVELFSKCISFVHNYYTEEENSPSYQRQVKLNYDTNQQSESNEIPSFQLQISEKIIHRRSPPTLHHRLTIRRLKIGIEKIQEMNNHFLRNESYIPTVSANLTTLPISEQNSILVDESVTHLKETCPTSRQIFQD